MIILKLTIAVVWDGHVPQTALVRINYSASVENALPAAGAVLDGIVTLNP